MSGRNRKRPHVVVVGAGFGGLWAVRRLKGHRVDVSLIDRNNYHTFLPLLYQVGAAELNASDITFPVRAIVRGWPNVRFVMGEVVELQPDARRIRTRREEFSYDALILATGSEPFYFGVPGAARYTFPLKQVEEALALRNHVLSRFERAVRISDARERRRSLTFAIVGGGATGIEYVGALAELVDGPVRRDYPELRRNDMGIVLVEARGNLLPGMPETLGVYALRRLTKMGVDVRLDTRVAEVGPTYLQFDDGSRLETETVVWTAGVCGDADAASWGLTTRPDGRVPVLPTLQVPAHPEIYVVGDLAWLEDGGPCPMVAPVATRQGRHAAENVLRQMDGETPLPFRFTEPGMLATIGRNAAVAHVFGRAFTGWPAWILWLGVHLVKLMGFRNRIVVLTDWAFDYLFFERAARLILPIRQAVDIEISRGQPALTAAESVLQEPENRA